MQSSTAEAARSPLYSLGEEIAHAVTHGLGLALSLAGLVALVAAAAVRDDARLLLGCAVFGGALVLLYAASTLYHGVPWPRAKAALRRVDHAAIFLLVAGTYTPFALVSLGGGWSLLLLAVVWGVALLGVGLQVVAPARGRRLAVPLHLATGWLALVAIEPLARSVHAGGVALLLLGGAAYTLGVVFYAWRRLPYHHAVWHVFVMAGSACHFSCVLGYVVPSGP